MNNTIKKKTGSFYTCNPIASYIANWAITDSNLHILEPSFGDGIFIDAALRRFCELGNSNPKITGIEIQSEPFDKYMLTNKKISGYQCDFMDYIPSIRYDAVIGNPPYVSLKNLDAKSKKSVINLMHNYGAKMQTCSSMWMPFIIHATELLRTNGRLGFVLPYEITYVRYAFDLWKYLSAHYGKLTICRMYYDFFPNVDVETVLLLAEDKGRTTNFVHYNTYKNISDLNIDNMQHTSLINIRDILNMEKPFERELLPESVVSILDNLRYEKKITPMINECKFKIGYVSGNKSFFHITNETIGKFGIHTENVRKSLINAKQINDDVCTGIETNNSKIFSNLFYPVSIGANEMKYIQYGETHGVNNAYKCKVRNPWYLTPGLEIPDVILTVFGDVPKLLLNNGNFYVSNSLLSGFSKNTRREELICRWYNSLTLLLVEMTIHSLGGGSLVFIPGETDKLEILSNFPTDKIDATYSQIATFAKKHKIEDVYDFGDRIVLRDIYGFNDSVITNIHLALNQLRSWRKPEMRRDILQSIAS